MPNIWPHCLVLLLCSVHFFPHEGSQTLSSPHLTIHESSVKRQVNFATLTIPPVNRIKQFLSLFMFLIKSACMRACVCVLIIWLWAWRFLINSFISPGRDAPSPLCQELIGFSRMIWLILGTHVFPGNLQLNPAEIQIV